jgi:Cys-rich protein (TIGR01571 family)
MKFKKFKQQLLALSPIPSSIVIAQSNKMRGSKASRTTMDSSRTATSATNCGEGNRQPAAAPPKMLRIVAPQKMPESYLFDVLVDGQPYSVRVPEGGLEEGEEFEIPYPTDLHDDDGTVPVRSSSEEETNSPTSAFTSTPPHPLFDDLGAPAGKWRVPLCSCCDVITQATFWMSIFCSPVLIAQLVSRLHLNWNGMKAASLDEASLSFNRIVLGFIAALFLGTVIPVVGTFIALVYVVVVLVVIGRNVRLQVRRRYRIPATICTEYTDDCLCMACCGCCSIIQIARHTHDDKEYPGYCCTNTGLELFAPDIPLIGEDEGNMMEEGRSVAPSVRKPRAGGTSIFRPSAKQSIVR